MEAWQQEHINQNLTALAECTRADAMVLAKLIAEGILKTSEIWALDAETTRDKMTLKLFQILMTRKQAYEALLRILEHQQQTLAASVLRSGSSKPATSHSHSPSLWTKVHIQRNLTTLAEMTSVNASLLARLWGEMSSADLDELNAEPTRHGKAVRLYTLFENKGENAYIALVKALRQECQSMAVMILESAHEYQQKFAV